MQKDATRAKRMRMELKKSKIDRVITNKEQIF